jgi:hypothetical protein
MAHPMKMKLSTMQARREIIEQALEYIIDYIVKRSTLDIVNH